MTKETEDKVAEAASILEEITNVYGCYHSLEALANKMASMHRTLVQSFTGGFVVPFIREMARKFRVERFDERNRDSAEACDEMAKALETKYDIGEMDELRFPCI